MTAVSPRADLTTSPTAPASEPGAAHAPRAGTPADTTAGTPPEAPRKAGRLPALDVLRGLAILGTLLTNIWIFSGVASNVGDVADESARSFAAVAFQNVLALTTDGKFIGLLTIMFGIGLEIQRQSAVRRGDAWPGTYPWRAGLLILDGLLNYFFIFEFDVLMGYGSTALVVCFIMARSPRAQKIWMAIGIAAHLAHLSYMTWGERVFSSASLERATSALDADPTDLAARQELARVSGRSVAEIDAEFARLSAESALHGDTSSYWAMVHERATNFVGGRGEIPIMFTMGLGLFLVGAHLYRAGLFLPEGARLRRWVMGIGFGIGIPLDWAARFPFADLAGPWSRYFTSTVVAFGVLAAIAAFYARGRRPGIIGRPLSYVGKMALTCYILQNLICSLIFYDYGLGLARRFPDVDNTVLTMVVYAVVCAMLITLSWAWLRRFPRGPVEWVWHLSYEAICRVLARRAQKRALRRAGSDTPAPVS